MQELLLFQAPHPEEVLQRDVLRVIEVLRWHRQEKDEGHWAWYQAHLLLAKQMSQVSGHSHQDRNWM